MTIKMNKKHNEEIAEYRDLEIQINTQDEKCSNGFIKISTSVILKTFLENINLHRNCRIFDKTRIRHLNILQT